MCPAMDIDYTIFRFQKMCTEQANHWRILTLAFFPSSPHCFLDNKDINIFEDGKESRDFIHVKDVASAVIKSINTAASNGEIINTNAKRNRNKCHRNSWDIETNLWQYQQSWTLPVISVSETSHIMSLIPKRHESCLISLRRFPCRKVWPSFANGCWTRNRQQSLRTIPYRVGTFRNVYSKVSI